MGFPFYTRNRSVMRVPVNPLDKSTIISVYPKDIDEIKTTLQPGRFHIDAAPEGDISVTAIGPSSWFKELEIDQPLLEIIEPSVEVARSVIDDYCSGLLGCDMGEKKPGLFWVPGVFSKEEAKKKFASEIAKAHDKQNNWFKELCNLADAFWIRTNGNAMAISDDMRIAAKALNLLDKPWLKDSLTMQLVKCKACGTLISESVVVCPNCKVILDAKRFAEMKFEFAR
jgi:hypothetical protein